MSSSSTVGGGDSGKFSGQKMTFSQTCNLLSQYVKEKRSLPRGTSDGFNNNNNNMNRATMNLFPLNGKQQTSGGVAEESNGCIGKTINLFPQLSGFNPSFQNACSNKRVSTEPPAPQMTIFYGGQVLVFNDLPADKAKEVMDLASSFESSLKKRKVETSTSAAPIAVPVPNPSLNPTQNPTPTPAQAQNVNVGPSFGKGVIPATVPRAPVPNVNDLPITRKASLHRFLEKRKDRLVGKAPPSTDANNGGSTKPAEGKTWLGLAPMPVYQPQQHL